MNSCTTVVVMTFVVFAIVSCSAGVIPEVAHAVDPKEVPIATLTRTGRQYYGGGYGGANANANAIAVANADAYGHENGYYPYGGGGYGNANANAVAVANANAYGHGSGYYGR